MAKAAKPKGPVKKTMKDSPLDDETGVPKVKLTSVYQAPWSTVSFTKDDWLGLMRDPAFRSGADASYKALVDGRRGQGAKIEEGEGASTDND